MPAHTLSLIVDDRWLTLLAALAGEALMGGRHALGRLPGPDGLIGRVEYMLEEKLNRPGRGAMALAVRGLVAVVCVALGAAAIGYGLRDWAGATIFGAILYILTLGFLLGSRPATDASFAIAAKLEETAAESKGDRRAEEDRYAAARWAVERLSNRYGDGLWANIFAFVTLGLPGLLAFRALSMACARSAPKGVFASRAPYDRWSTLLYQLFTVIPGMIATLVLSLASLCVPGTRIVGPWRAFMGAQANAIRIRIWAVNGFAHPLRLALPGALPGEQGPKWLGPEDGVARARAKDLRRALMLFGVAWLVTFGVVAAGAMWSVK